MREEVLGKGPAAGGPVRRGDAGSRVLRLRRLGSPECPRPEPGTSADSHIDDDLIPRRSGILPEWHALPDGRIYIAAAPLLHVDNEAQIAELATVP